MIDMKEKLHQAAEGLKQAKAKMDPYFDKAKPFLHRAKALTLEGMKSVATKTRELKDNYLQKKALEKERLTKTSNPITPPTSKAKNDTQQPPSNP